MSFDDMNLRVLLRRGVPAGAVMPESALNTACCPISLFSIYGYMAVRKHPFYSIDFILFYSAFN